MAKDPSATTCCAAGRSLSSTPPSSNGPSAQSPAVPHHRCSLVWAQGARSVHAGEQLPEVPEVYPGREAHQVLGSELSNSHTLGAISLQLVPLLVQLPMCPRPPFRGAAAALALPAGPVFSPFLPKSRVPQEAVRAGHPSASCRLRRALPLAPPSPRAGVTG